MESVKGFKTLIFNGGFAALIGLLTWATGVDWTMHVDPTVAMFVVAGVNVALRIVTNSPVGKAS